MFGVLGGSDELRVVEMRIQEAFDVRLPLHEGRHQVRMIQATDANLIMIYPSLGSGIHATRHSSLSLTDIDVWASLIV